MSSPKKYKIEYKGVQLSTDLWTPLSDEEFQKAKEDYFAKPELGEVLQQLKSIANGGSKINLIGRYYFRDLMSKVKLRFNKWTIEDVYDGKSDSGTLFLRKEVISDKFDPKKMPWN